MRTIEIDPSTQRVLLAICLVLATLYGAAYVLLLDFFPPPPADLSPQQVAQLYSHANLQFKIGVVIMIITGGFWSVYSPILAMQLARDEIKAPLWASIMMSTAPFQTLLFAFPAVMWGFASFTAERAPELTAILHEAAWLCFVTPVSCYPFMMIAVAMVCLSKKRDPETSPFPRWMGWISLWTALGAEFGWTALIFKSGPFSWNGLFPFYLPTFTFLIWFVCMTYNLFRAITLQERAAAVRALAESRAMGGRLIGT